VHRLFENVGGPVFEAALTVMAPHSRVALCGIISEYDSQPYGNKSMRSILINRINIRGYICSDPDVACNQIEGIQQLLKENKIHSLIHEFQPSGIESVPKALVGLFEGQNTGKMTVKIN
jgi:NADPH-dependent curcumin reductase